MAQRLSLLSYQNHVNSVSTRAIFKSVRKLNAMAAEHVDETMAGLLPHNIDQHNSFQPMNFVPSVRAASEKKLGLLYSASSARDGWRGDARKRYDNLPFHRFSSMLE